ncbi:hypothetical protein [Roseimicrobium sp. ORNL1]|uniref:hypothetical protein n=1 Tax=Roseimicrobium sp. ORNL1 TaxID=2711231 RepID=UPI0013E1F2E8|nr:hypothetical protein [Roseimicrobium sp. ORNL1]QIF00848.1 hypothetical protein G5S37_04690 [Roseimicrobium sp. ORNL1]
MPDPSSEVSKAASMSIMFLGVIILGMMGLFIKIMFNFARREREFDKSSSAPQS